MDVSNTNSWCWNPGMHKEECQCARYDFGGNPKANKPSNSLTKRGQILQRAMELCTGERNDTHGTPENNMGLFAELLEAYLNHPITKVDAAIVMCLSKIARIGCNQAHEDHYIDLAGYAAIAGELNHE